MRPSKYIVLLLAALLGLGTLRAQKEANVWYFGYQAGIDFNGTEPTPLTNGNLSTSEGSASISDTNGNVLFYTDGISVWNRNHQIMPNGSDLFGHSSSSQSGVIVPLPQNPNLYYIFTVDMQAGVHGLCYSIVDMTLDEGRGDIIQKNINLFSPASEKITAVKHENGEDYWIIAHRWNSQQFMTYLLSANGLNQTPVISEVGSSHTGNLGNTIGYMKASSNGEHLALALYGDGLFEIFDFDDSNGNLSNPITLSGYPAAYGVEFSADGQYVYGTLFSSKKLYQFNLAYQTADLMQAAAHLVATSSHYLGGIQLAPDGRLYIARFNSNTLARVEYPELRGNLVGFNEEALELAGRSSSLGLPTYVQSYFADPLGRALPVELWQLQARHLGDKIVAITWESELEEGAFILEKSEDGKHFRELARVAASTGSNYYEDQKVEENAYYRLRELSTDQERWSQVVYVALAEAEAALNLEFYPNPIQREVKLQHNLPEDSEVISRLYDQRGQLLWQFKGEVQNLSQAAQGYLPNLPSGSYLMKLDAVNYHHTQRLVKY